MMDRKTSDSQPNSLHLAVEELVKTEEVYVSELQDIYQAYMPCVRLLGGVEHEKVIFSNITDILSLHQELLQDLWKANGDILNISRCFTERAPDFHIYSTYCTRYHRANERLFELKHANLPLSDSLREVQKSLGHALPLSSYLHKPVQRILKYHLIFKNLMNLCEQSSAMRSTVGEAYMSMTDSAHAVNNSKRLTEMDLKTRQLHELILTVRESDHLGKLMREGEMTMRNNSMCSRVFLYLFENVLVICHKPKDNFSLHSIFRCADLLVLERCSRKETEFSVVPFSTPSHTINLAAESLAQKLDWCIQLDKLTNCNIPSKAKKLLMSTTERINDTRGKHTVAETRSPHHQLRLPLLSPHTIGKRLRSRLFTQNSQQKASPMSSLNNSLSSLSSDPTRSPQQTSDTASCKSASSLSSDLGSSIITEPERLLTGSLARSYDDCSVKLTERISELERQNLASWDRALRKWVQKQSVHLSTREDNSRRGSVLSKSQSCSDMLHLQRVKESTKLEQVATLRQAPAPLRKNRSVGGSLWDLSSNFFKKAFRRRKTSSRLSKTGNSFGSSSCQLGDSPATDSPTADQTSLYDHRASECHPRKDKCEDKDSLLDGDSDDDVSFQLNVTDGFSDTLLTYMADVFKASPSS